MAVVGAAVVDVARDELAQFGAAQCADVPLAVVLVQETRLFLQRLGMRRPQGGVDDAGAQVAVDGVIADALLHKSLRFLAEIPQQAGTLAADEVEERFRVEALAAGKLAAVAPRGAPADAPGLEHDGLVAALGEEIGRASCRERVCQYV